MRSKSLCFDAFSNFSQKFDSSSKFLWHLKLFFWRYFLCGFTYNISLFNKFICGRSFGPVKTSLDRSNFNFRPLSRSPNANTVPPLCMWGDYGRESTGTTTTHTHMSLQCHSDPAYHWCHWTICSAVSLWPPVSLTSRAWVRTPKNFFYRSFPKAGTDDCLISLTLSSFHLKLWQVLSSSFYMYICTYHQSC